ncbi:reverse transcriptase domain-containing protein [Tanacetum coccineum]
MDLIHGSDVMRGRVSWGAGLILTNPEGMEFTYALRFEFTSHDKRLSTKALSWGTNALQLEWGADYVLREIHAGSCSMHSGPRSVVARALRSGYYWPTMHRDARDMIKKCNDCQTTLLNGIGQKRCHNHRESGEGSKLTWIDNKGRRVEELSHVLWAHRTTIKVSTGDTPFSLVYGTEAVIPAEIGMPTIRTAEVNIATNDDERRIDLDILEERREQAAIREEKAKLKMKGYYDAKVRGVSFRPGDFVYRANDASHAEDTGKLGPKWEGPYEVTEALGKGAYKLRDMDGRELPRTWNICNLKKCYL